MTRDYIECDGCGISFPTTKTEMFVGWIAVEKRGGLISLSTTLYTCSNYKHYCIECAERGITI